MRNAMLGWFLILAAGNFAHAQSVVIVAADGPSDHGVYPLEDQIAVGFKSPTHPPEVTSVTLPLEGAEGAPDVTLTLHVNGFLALAATPGSQIAVLGNLVVPPGVNNVTFTPSAPVELEPSTDYFLVLTCNNCDDSDMGPTIAVGWRVTRALVVTGLPGATVSAGTLIGGGDMWEYFALDTPIFTVNGLGPITLDTRFQVRYASNLVHGDSVVNITNTGANGAPLYGPGFGITAGNICVNVYAFSPDEQLISCCSCPVTPNGLVNLTANRDLVSNTLTGISPDSIVIKLVATATGVQANTPGIDQGSQTVSGTPIFTGSNCANSAALAGTSEYQVANGLLAWGTTLHSSAEPVNPQSMMLTETQFLPAKLSYDELKSIRQRCANIIGNGSTFGICRSCRLGGLGGAKQ